MFLLHNFKFLLNIFYWTGLAPFPTFDGKQKCYYYVITVVVSCLINVGLVAALFSFPLYGSYGNIAVLVNYAYGLSVSLSNLCANLQCYHYKSVYSKIIKQIMKIEMNFSIKFSSDSSFRTVAHRYKLDVIIITILFLIFASITFYELWLDYSYQFFIIIFLNALTQYISALSLFQVLLHTSIVQIFVRELNRRIKNAPITFNSKTKLGFLKTIKSMHMECWKLTMQINKYFSWSLPFLIIQLSIQAIYFFYWVFLLLQQEWNSCYIAGKIVKETFVDCFVGIFEEIFMCKSDCCW